MLLFDRLKVRSKLLLLIGVPVLGILALSVLVVRDVQERAQAAAGLGSMEDLAHLTERILDVIDELQWERAEVTYGAGTGSLSAPRVKHRQQRTDDALETLSGFLKERDEAKLPAKLRQDLKAARERLSTLPALRQKSEQADFEILAYLDFFAQANDSLIRATAALMQLSDDKQLLVSMGGLVSAMQVIERNAREHALMNYVFGKQDFPPGTFRYLVTLLTEQQVYTESLRTWSSEEEFMHLNAGLKGPMSERIAAMRSNALENTEETFSVTAPDWFAAQSSNLEALGRMEREMAGAVRAAVSGKVAASRRAVRLAMGLVLGVVAVSLLIGWAITRSLTRSVRVLSLAAEEVHKNHDFTIRAEKTSSDELGLFTDAFNGMLAGIEERDRELETHRKNLEALVEGRTRQLSNRNEEMRLVLDNIDQGLAMIDRRGNFLGECSRKFREAFGEPKPGDPFYQTLTKDDPTKSFALEAGYEQLIADVLPVELALDQLPRSVVLEGRHYALSFTPVLHGGQVAGALLVTRDVTLELLARRAEVEQHQRVQIFEQVMRDRIGFEEFLLEAQGLMARIRADAFVDPREKLRVLHTLKGVTSVFGAVPLSEATHALEQACVQGSSELATSAQAILLDSWEAFQALIGPGFDDESQRPVELTQEELAELVQNIRDEAPHPVLLHSLLHLSREPVAQRFQRIEGQIKRLARRLHKPDPIVIIDANDVRVPAAKFREFWANLAHVVRNIVDHGLEPETERFRRGKPNKNRVVLRAWSDEIGLFIELADDGRGIDWNRLAQKARENDSAADSRAEISIAIFAGGLSTAKSVSQISGRGVGMSAVHAACLALGGSISLESEPGQGTRVRFAFPPLSDSVPPVASSSPARDVAAGAHA